MNTTLISERIRQSRKARGLTQSELAEQMRMSEMTVRRWEANKTSPRMEEIQKLAEVLNIPVSELLEDTSESLSIPQIHIIPTQEKSTQETNTGMAVLTLETGRKIEVPATPEGYSFLKDLFMMSLKGDVNNVNEPSN